jgi:hypothetical protein
LIYILWKFSEPFLLSFLSFFHQLGQLCY